MAILTIKDLVIKFQTNDSIVNAVNGFSAELKQRQMLGIVGESGSGKSQTVLAIMQLLAKNAVVSGSILFENKELVNAPNKEMQKIRGNKIAMVFQDPMSCLNPYVNIGRQLTEVLITHGYGNTRNISKRNAEIKVLECLDMVKISNAKSRLKQYPHEFSGGMRQRIMIAMALLCKPKLLIADEPTTALDVTVQAGIMQLLSELKNQLEMAIVLITHDLGVVAGHCDDVIVMYGGRIMERGKVEDIFYRSKHPYTKGLLSSIPNLQTDSDDLFVIPGQPIKSLHEMLGCPFNERCNYKIEKCLDHIPQLVPVSISSNGHDKACHFEGI